jgi:copper homeostasis protein
MTVSPVLLEAAVESIESAVLAEEAGAGRLELCVGLVEGGLTPSAGIIEEVRSRVNVPVFVLIRPRSGDACYSREELTVMRRDIAIAKSLGVHGVVLGVVTPEGTVDTARTRDLALAARPMAVTFHRAFDLTRDADEALDAIIGIGLDRVLTSGQRATALEGADVIAGLVRRGAGRIRIVAGGKVSPANAREIVQRTGVRELHARAAGPVPGPMRYRREQVVLGRTYTPDEYSRVETSPDLVKGIVRAAGGGE